RAIVDDDELDFHAALGEQMTNRLFNPGFLIARRDDNRTLDAAFGWCRSGRWLQRGQPPDPAHVPESGTHAQQEERGRPAEDESDPHGPEAWPLSSIKQCFGRPNRRAPERVIT